MLTGLALYTTGVRREPGRMKSPRPRCGDYNTPIRDSPIGT
jgi:hypothetical protein